MTTPRRSPLVGYNTAVHYRGVPYHIQTEDSGIEHPHVITHMFAAGGHIIATRKTSYREHVGTDAYPEVVRRIIRTQHKEMIVALRDGVYDSLLPRTDARDNRTETVAPAPPAVAAVSAEPRERHEKHRRAYRRPPTEPETTRDSLDEIIVGDLVRVLDESR